MVGLGHSPDSTLHLFGAQIACGRGCRVYETDLLGDPRQAASDHRRRLLSDSCRVSQDVRMMIQLFSATVGLLVHDHARRDDHSLGFFAGALVLPRATRFEEEGAGAHLHLLSLLHLLLA